ASASTGASVSPPASPASLSTGASVSPPSAGTAASVSTGVSVPLSESGVVSAGTVLSAGALVVSTGVGPASAPASSCAAGTLPLSSSPQPTKVSALPSAIKANKFLVFNIGSLDSS